MKKNYYFLLICIFIFFGKTSAQFGNSILPEIDRLIIGPPNVSNNLPLSNFHFFNPYYYNPAMAGIEDKKRINTSWNRQMNHSFSASYEQPVSSINSAFGAHFSYSSNFFTSVRYYGLAYNYRFKIKDKARLNLGVQFSQISLAFDESFLGFSPNISKWYNGPSLDLGLALQVKQFRFGASVQNLFPSQIITADGIGTFFNVDNGERQINFTLANTFRLSEDWDWSLASLFRYAKSQDIHDFSSYISFRKKIFFGTTYRTEVEHHWIAFVGVKIKEKVNLQFSFNEEKDDYEDHRFFEILAQYQF